MKKINLEKISYLLISLSIFILIGIGGDVACGYPFPWLGLVLSIILYSVGKIILKYRK